MIRSATTKLYNWATEKATSSKAPLWIGLIFFLEIFLLLPLDAVMIFFCLQNIRKTFLYIVIAALASTLSGVMGYLLGHFLWDFIGPYVVPHLISASFFDRLSGHLNAYTSWAVFISALLPLPLKAFSLASGAFHLNLAGYIFGLLAARLLRFTLIGTVVLLWGEKVKTIVDKHFHNISIAIILKLLGAAFFIWFFAAE
ncbi:MAG: VTT domain-containing protein [Verrucomicrobia bacterium]|nr:VTT domain-containing protein [Verrucomicrobiota bacterium]